MVFTHITTHIFMIHYLKKKERKQVQQAMIIWMLVSYLIKEAKFLQNLKICEVCRGRLAQRLHF